MMNRRNFLASSAAGFVGTAAVSEAQSGVAGGSFKLKYAPSLGMFPQHAGRDPIDNIKFASDVGFRAVYDLGIRNKSLDLQSKIGSELDRLGMELGPFGMGFSSKEPTLVTRDPSVRDGLIKQAKLSVEVSKRINCKWTLLVPGNISQNLEMDYQTANVVENLRYLMDVAEPAGLVVVLEPLNWWRNHPGKFLQKIPQAYLVCRAVNSPSCKIVNDIYHQQISEGNLIPNIDMAWDEIGAFHIGDNPGRNEPGTGEINYKNVFEHIHDKGFEGILCMEHGKSLGKGLEAEKAVIEAYRQCDDF